MSNSYKISVEASAKTLDEAKASFKRVVADLDQKDFAVGTGYAGGGGGGPSISASIRGPQPAPLAAEEINGLRRILEANPRFMKPS